MRVSSLVRACSGHSRRVTIAAFCGRCFVKISGDLHDWNVSYEEARHIQQRLSARVKLTPLRRGIRLVAGADVALDRCRGLFFAAVVVLGFPELEVVDERTASGCAGFPYVPGLLSFREAPVVLKAMAELAARPDVVIFDGQGIAHPRRLGLASHMGLWLGIPTVGAAKSRLVGEHEEPGQRKGEWAALRDGGEQIGSVLRTRSCVKPLYVSPGHLCDHEAARRIVLQCCTRYRLPEPTRLAHTAVARAKAAAANP